MYKINTHIRTHRHILYQTRATTQAPTHIHAHARVHSHMHTRTHTHLRAYTRTYAHTLFLNGFILLTRLRFNLQRQPVWDVIFFFYVNIVNKK